MGGCHLDEEQPNTGKEDHKLQDSSGSIIISLVII